MKERGILFVFVAVLGTLPLTIISMNDYFWDGSPTLGEGINVELRYLSIRTVWWIDT